MSGKYNGVQSDILRESPLAIFVQRNATAGRYEILMKKLQKSNKPVYVPKKLSDTRWPCRADATKAIVCGYEEIKESLRDISKDQEQKSIVQNEAKGLLKQMCRVEIAIYALF